MNEKCPDHDELIRLKTIIDNDHPQLKQRVTDLESAYWRAVGAIAVFIAIAGVVGVVIGHLWK